jgi:hypothetical protein
MELIEHITNIILDMDTYDGTKGHSPAMIAAGEIMEAIRRHDEEGSEVDCTGSA